MRYKNAKDLLPENILSEIQNYIDGEYVYIPKKDNTRKKWGELSKIREKLAVRNIQIYNDFLQGISLDDLSKRYYLELKTLQKIIARIKVGNK